MKLLELTPSQKKTVRHQFDNFCKKVLREEARNYAKHIAWRSEHEVSLSELSEEQINRAYILDEHKADRYICIRASQTADTPRSLNEGAIIHILLLS